MNSIVKKYLLFFHVILLISSLSCFANGFEPILQWKAPPDTIFEKTKIDFQWRLMYGSKDLNRLVVTCGVDEKKSVFLKDSTKWMDPNGEIFEIGWGFLHWQDSLQLFLLDTDDGQKKLLPRVYSKKSNCEPQLASNDYSIEICARLGLSEICKSKSFIVKPLFEMVEIKKFHFEIKVNNPKMKVDYFLWDLNANSNWDLKTKEPQLQILKEDSAQLVAGVLLNGKIFRVKRGVE